MYYHFFRSREKMRALVAKIEPATFILCRLANCNQCNFTKAPPMIPRVTPIYWIWRLQSQTFFYLARTHPEVNNEILIYIRIGEIYQNVIICNILLKTNVFFPRFIKKLQNLFLPFSLYLLIRKIFNL